MTLRMLSLFSGVGGLDLAAHWAGIETAAFCESDPLCRKVLRRNLGRDIQIFDDVRKLTLAGGEGADILAGGDPCPKHSRARSNGESNHPDLAGYFLAVAGRLKPRWVLRENVPAPTVAHFDAALAALGYGTVVIRGPPQRIRARAGSGISLSDFIKPPGEASETSLRTAKMVAGLIRRSSARGRSFRLLLRTEHDTTPVIVTFGKRGEDSESWTVTSARPLPDSLKAGLLDYLRRQSQGATETP